MTAAVVDGVAALALALTFSQSLGFYFSSRAVVAFQMDSPTSWWKGPIPLVLGVFGKLVYLLPLACIVVLLAEPLFRRSLGKAVTGLELRCGDGATLDATTSWSRFIVKAAPLGAAVAGLLVGRWELLVLAICLAMIVGLGFAPVLFGRRALHDRWVGTSVALAKP